MEQRTMDEMISSFNQEVIKMDIKHEDKIKLLGMITAIGYKSKKQERKTGRWIKIRDEEGGNTLYECSECHSGEIHVPIVEVPYCWKCGAKMEVEHD